MGPPLRLQSAARANELKGYAGEHAEEKEATMAIQFTNCSQNPHLIADLRIHVTPDPPVVGRTVTETWTFDSHVELPASAKVRQVGHVGIFKVSDITMDLGSVPGVQCPIVKGERTVRIEYVVPADAPAGVTINVERTVTNPDGTEVLCCKGDMKFNRG